VKNAIRNGHYEIKPYEGLELDLLKDAFGAKGLYEGMIAENTPDPLTQVDLKRFEELLPAIADKLDKLPSEEKIYQILSAAGCIKSVQEVGLQESIIPQTICLSPYVRNRLTFMRLIKLLRLS
jgi:glycerol-1-phosphate dehydrogenase [NAD(P)+]